MIDEAKNREWLQANDYDVLDDDIIEFAEKNLLEDLKFLHEIGFNLNDKKVQKLLNRIRFKK